MTASSYMMAGSSCWLVTPATVSSTGAGSMVAAYYWDLFAARCVPLLHSSMQLARHTQASSVSSWIWTDADVNHPLQHTS
jgi:hypothetical protein